MTSSLKYRHNRQLNTWKDRHTHTHTHTHTLSQWAQHLAFFLTMGFTFREPPSPQTAPGDHDGRVSVCICVCICYRVCVRTCMSINWASHPTNKQTDGEQRHFVIDCITLQNQKKTVRKVSDVPSLGIGDFALKHKATEKQDFFFLNMGLKVCMEFTLHCSQCYPVFSVWLLMGIRTGWVYVSACSTNPVHGI